MLDGGRVGNSVDQKLCTLAQVAGLYTCRMSLTVSRLFLVFWEWDWGEDEAGGVHDLAPLFGITLGHSPCPLHTPQLAGVLNS